MAQKLSEVSGAEGREDIAEHVLSMMDPDPAKRPTGAVPWAQQLAAAAVSDAQMTTISQRTTPLPVTDVMPPPSVESKDDSKSRRTPLLILGAFVALLVAGAAAFFVLGGGSDDDATAESAAVVTTEATETTEAVTTTAATTTTEATTTTVAVVAVPRFGSTTTIEEAQAELTDLGLLSEVVLQEGPGPYGVVQSTDPASGADLAPGSTVFLTASVQPSAMPSVVGESTASGVKTLESYGVTVSTAEVLDETAADNTIIDQTPKPGEAFASEAQVVVSRKPAIVYLADLESLPVANRLRNRTGAGERHRLHPHRASRPPPSGYWIEYDLARSFTRLVGGVGPRDDIASDNFKIEIFSDGTPRLRPDTRARPGRSHRLLT